MKQFKNMVVALFIAGLLFGSTYPVSNTILSWAKEKWPSVTENQVDQILDDNNLSLAKYCSKRVRNALIDALSNDDSSDDSPVINERPRRRMTIIDDDSSSEDERPVFGPRNQYGPINRPSNYVDLSDDESSSGDERPIFSPINRPSEDVGLSFSSLCKSVLKSGLKSGKWWYDNVGIARTIGIGAFLYNVINFRTILNSPDFVKNIDVNQYKCLKSAGWSVLSLVPVVGIEGTKKVINLLTCGSCFGKSKKK